MQALVQVCHAVDNLFNGVVANTVFLFDSVKDNDKAPVADCSKFQCADAAILSA